MYYSNKKMFIFVIVAFQTFASGQIDKNRDMASKMMENIKKSEQQINDIQAKVKWWEPETNNLLEVSDWGYDKGKEFIDSKSYFDKNKDTPSSEEKYTFDGDIQRIYSHN